MCQFATAEITPDYWSNCYPLDRVMYLRVFFMNDSVASCTVQLVSVYSSLIHMMNFPYCLSFHRVDLLYCIV